MKYIVLSLRNPAQVLSHVKMKTTTEHGYTEEKLAEIAQDPDACPIMALDDDEPLPPIGSVWLGGTKFGPPPDEKPPLEALKEAIAADITLHIDYIQSFLDGSITKAVEDATTHEELDDIRKKYNL